MTPNFSFSSDFMDDADGRLERLSGVAAGRPWLMLGALLFERLGGRVDDALGGQLSSSDVDSPGDSA